MAITTGSLVRVALAQSNLGEVQMNIWDYLVLELAGIPTAGNYAEAWWNHVKTAYRAMALATNTTAFSSVRVTELGNPTGEYGEFSVPTGERAGTRTSPGDADMLPSYAAIGVRLSVATRSTRPGQKRFGFLTQTDLVNNDVQSAIGTLTTTLMNVMTTNITLGAPAAGVVLVPHVVSLNGDGTVRAHQAVTGYAINAKATSQVSRRYGRGV